MPKKKSDLTNETKCPECGSPIQVDKFDEIGDTILCPDCNAEFELIKVNPPKLRRFRETEYSEESYEDLDDFVDYKEDDKLEWD